MKRELYDQLYVQEKTHWWFVSRRAILSKVLSSRLFINRKKAPLILEIGCGTGGNLELLSKFGTLSAIEFDKEALQLSKEKNVCNVVEGSLPHHIPLDKTYNVIAMFDVLEHIEEDLASLLAIKKILHKNGRLLLTVPAFMFLWSDHDDLHHHKRRYTKKSLTNVLKQAGYNIEYLTYFNTFLFPVVSLVRLVSRLLKRRSGSDISNSTPSFLNDFLTVLFSAERHFFPRFSFPFGVSLLVVVKNI